MRDKEEELAPSREVVRDKEKDLGPSSGVVRDTEKDGGDKGKAGAFSSSSSIDKAETLSEIRS